jgi:hypothetical protein
MYCIVDEYMLSVPNVQYCTSYMYESDTYMVQIPALKLTILNGNA